jgi:hypothetical protein
MIRRISSGSAISYAEADTNRQEEEVASRAMSAAGRWNLTSAQLHTRKIALSYVNLVAMARRGSALDQGGSPLVPDNIEKKRVQSDEIELYLEKRQPATPKTKSDSHFHLA